MAEKRPIKDLSEGREEVNENVQNTAESGLSSMSIQVRKKEVTWILGAMVFILVIIFLSSYLAKSSNTFTYKTLKFEKQTFGTIPVYVYGYTFKDITGSAIQEYNYQLLLRLDPRQNAVPIEGDIDLSKWGRELYISVNTSGFEACTTTTRDLATLSGFLTGNLFDIKGGVPDSQAAAEANVTHISCDLYPANTVLLIQTANATSIDKPREGCYILNVANCETLNVIEKFEIQSLIDAKSRKST